MKKIVKKITVIATILFVSANVGFAQLKVKGGAGSDKGNVGIGGDPSIWTNSKLKIGDIWTFYDGDNDKEICRNTRYSNGYYRLQTGVASLMGFAGNGDILFRVSPSGTGGTAITNWNSVVIKNNGRVGIGTTAPSTAHKLHVEGPLLVNAVNVMNWGSAIRANVYQPQACAYHLTTNGSDVFYVRGDGYVCALRGYLTTSDRNFKKDIKPIDGALNKVLALEGVSYQFNDAKETDGFRLGFVAQDVEKIVPEAVKDIHDGTKAMSYTDLIALLVEATKEQQNIIENLQQKVISLEKNCCTNNTLKSNDVSIGLTDLLTTSSATQEMHLSDNTEIETLKLYQNAPNPFNERTTIKCYVPQQIQKAQLCVYNMHGVLVQCLDITERGNVELFVEAGALSAGVYSYVLLADGIASDTKQMILTK